MRDQALFRAVLFVASVVLIVYGMAVASQQISMLMLTVFLTVVLMIPLRWLKSRGFSSGVAVLIVSFAVFLCGLGIVGVVASSGTTFARKLPEYQRKLTAYVETIDRHINDIADSIAQHTDSIASTVSKTVMQTITSAEQDTAVQDAVEQDTVEDNAVEEPNQAVNTALIPLQPTEIIPLQTAVAAAPNNRFSIVTSLSSVGFTLTQHLVRGIVDVASVASMVVILVVFALLEASQFPAKVAAAFGERSEAGQQLDAIAKTIVHYTLIKTIVSIATGVAVTLVLWLLGIEYAVLWGLFACFFNFIPNFGPIIASTPPVLLALIDGGAGTACWCLLGLTTVHTISGYVVEPRYMGDGLGISPLVVLLSMLVWGWLFGLTGMFLSAPLTMVVKIVLDAYDSTRWIAILLEDKPRESGVTSV